MADSGRINTIRPICNPWAETDNSSSGTAGFQASLEQSVVAWSKDSNPYLQGTLTAGQGENYQAIG